MAKASHNTSKSLGCQKINKVFKAYLILLSYKPMCNMLCWTRIQPQLDPLIIPGCQHSETQVCICSSMHGTAKPQRWQHYVIQNRSDNSSFCALDKRSSGLDRMTRHGKKKAAQHSTENRWCLLPQETNKKIPSCVRLLHFLLLLKAEYVHTVKSWLVTL